MKMRITIVLCGIFIAAATVLGAPQNTNVVFLPTAGLLEHRQYSTRLDILPSSQQILYVNVGLWGVLQVGLSYGATGLLGYGDLTPNAKVGLEARARVVEEDEAFPAIAVGVATQGWGNYDAGLERYRYKSPGAYAVVSRNWWALGGNMGLHIGAAYNFIENSDEHLPTIFAGFDKDYDNVAGISLEYDAALNDMKHNERYGEGAGYFSGSLWWRVSYFFRFDILFTDIAANSYGINSVGRGFRLTVYDVL